MTETKVWGCDISETDNGILKPWRIHGDEPDSDLGCSQQVTAWRLDCPIPAWSHAITYVKPNLLKTDFLTVPFFTNEVKCILIF